MTELFRAENDYFERKYRKYCRSEFGLQICFHGLITLKTEETTWKWKCVQSFTFYLPTTS